MKPNTLPTPFIRGVLVLAGLLLAASPLHAANQAIWISGDTVNGGTNWSDMTNWSGSILPSPGDDLIINDVLIVTNFMLLDDASHTIGKLQMGVNGTRTNTFSIRSTNLTAVAGNQLIITNGLFATNDAVVVGPTLTIQTPVTVQGNQTWTVACTPAGAGTLNNPKGVRLASRGVTSGSTNAVLTLNGTLIKDGLGMLSLANGVQQTNGGNIFVKEGTLLLDSTSFPRLLLAAGGTIIVTNGATLAVAAGPFVYSAVQKQVDMLTGSTLALGVGGTTGAEFQAPVHWNGTNSLLFNAITGAEISFNFSNANWTGNSVITYSNASSISGGVDLGTRGSNAAFYGKFIFNGGGTVSAKNLFRFMSDDAGSPNAEWVLNSPSTATNAIFELYGSGVSSVQLGALSGDNGTIRPVFNGALKTLVVGALNTSTTCGARLVDTLGYLALVKVGTGSLTLTSDSGTYTGGTIVSNGVLASLSLFGSSVGTGPVSIMSGATFSGSGPSSSCAVTNYNGGTLDAPAGPALTLASLTLGANSTDVTTNSFNVGNAGQINSGSSLTVSGTNVINITGAGIPVGVYDIINYSGSGFIGGDGFAAFKLGSLPPGVTANLQNAAGTAVQLNVTASTGVNTTPTNITFAVSGGSITMSWPPDYQGWRLECQTNTLATGLGNGWVTIPGSESVTSTNFPINPSNPTVFYRLVYP